MSRSRWANRGWKFHLGEISEGSYKGLDDSSWQSVCLPHDWSVSLPFSRDCSSGTGYLPGGIGWYRLQFTLPEDVLSKMTRVTFEGIYQNARVWINSNYLGKRPYGYSTFSYDISEFLVPGENVLAVRAEHIDLADSRWFTGAGMTRGVFFTFTDPLHFPENSVFVYTKSTDEQKAELGVSWALSGEGQASFVLLDQTGRETARADASGKEGTAALHVDRPLLWSPEQPALYTLKASAYSADGDLKDEVLIKTGIRTFRFDADEGFFLNGAGRKLKGVCLHHDAGALGAAVPENVWRRRLEKLKDAGCDAIRTSHNPPDPKLLDLCDSMGFLVIDEAFDEWEGCKNKWWQGHNVYPPKRFGYADEFPQWHETDLAAMVRRDRNHPSVILWSIGNEIDYPNDPYVHPLFEMMTGNNDANKPAAERMYDSNRPGADRLTVIAKKLTAIVKREDSTRPVTAALAFPELSNRIGFAQALDVAGYNYKEHLYEEDHRDYPGMIILGTENSTRAEAWLPVKHLPYISGQFLWTGIDYLGEARGWPVRLSPAGLLDTAGFEKPLFAQRKALWSGEKTARLAVGEDGQVWHERFGWDGKPGQTLHASCYTNAKEAEIFINGRSLGVLPVGEDCAARWTLPYEEGELLAIARWDDGTQLEDRLASAAGKEEMRLTAVETSAPADGYSLVQVELRLLDGQGQTVCARDEEVSFTAQNGLIMGIENGAMDDLTPYASHARRTHLGRLIVYLRAGTSPGQMTLTASRAGQEKTISIQLFKEERHD